MRESPEERRRRLLDGIYQDLSPEDLAKAGRKHLDQDLRLRSSRHRRRFWLIASALALATVAGIIFAALALLERVRGDADRFGTRQGERWQRELKDPD